MGALISRILRRWWRLALGQPDAMEEEADVVEVAREVVDEVEEGSEEAGPSTRQLGLKQYSGTRRPQEDDPSDKRAKDSSESTYEALFIRGEGSDVQIRALGEAWNLHRAYLCQSGYFASMFSGAWREATMNTIELQMPDENIDAEALHDALGSLYQDSVFIPPSRVIPMLAAASMLQLDGLLQQCGGVMRETVSVQTVCKYYYSAENYGLPNIKTMCFQWLLNTLMTWDGEQLLGEVSLDLMRELIASSDLLVLEVEMDVYTMLKKWMFLQLQPTWRGPCRALLTDTNDWLHRSKRESQGTPLLDTEEGRSFVPVFQQLRLAYIIWDLSSVRTINLDGVIPVEWLTPLFNQEWVALYHAEQMRELGPNNVNVSDIQRQSMRCGAWLHRNKMCSWRWTGFSFRLDIVVCYSNRHIILWCRMMHQYRGLRVGQFWQRQIAYRLRLISFDRAGNAVFRKDTEYQTLILRETQELVAVNMENQDVVFPMYVACNFLYLPRQERDPQ